MQTWPSEQGDRSAQVVAWQPERLCVQSSLHVTLPDCPGSHKAPTPRLPSHGSPRVTSSWPLPQGWTTQLPLWQVPFWPSCWHGPVSGAPGTQEPAPSGLHVVPETHAPLPPPHASGASAVPVELQRNSVLLLSQRALLGTQSWQRPAAHTPAAPLPRLQLLPVDGVWAQVPPPLQLSAVHSTLSLQFASDVHSTQLPALHTPGPPALRMQLPATATCAQLPLTPQESAVQVLPSSQGASSTHSTHCGSLCRPSHTPAPPARLQLAPWARERNTH